MSRQDDPESRPEQPVSTTTLPRITIRFCTQCKWMLRAAYYAQELLSTFSTTLGEVALQPSTGGTFVITIEYQPSDEEARSGHPANTQLQSKVIWDRKIDGGFPETKELKRRVRDIVEPGRDLGHVDRSHAIENATTTTGMIRTIGDEAGAPKCEDCK